MSHLGQVRIGHRAPDFHCEAVVGGSIKEVSLSTFIRPSTSPGSADSDAPWLLLLFIPAAFSFVCPTEVIAFQTCYEEFQERHCSIAFISVDTKHSLWHWQNVPRQYGGLGNIEIPLLSDATHKIGRDYGVLFEEEGVCLRGMFIIDGQGLVQQITLNNLTVGRSVLEALRLLEAFQAVAKHGILCPIDWKPDSNASDTVSTISNTLLESYDDRLANLQKEFGDVQVTDLDMKHKTLPRVDSIPHAEFTDLPGPQINLSPAESEDITADARDPPPTPGHTVCTPRVLPPTPRITTEGLGLAINSQPSSPITAVSTLVATPVGQHPPPLKLQSMERTARHSRGHHSAHHHHKALTEPPRKVRNFVPGPNTYESQGGSFVVLEFADPISSPMVSPIAEHNLHKGMRPKMTQRASSPPTQSIAARRAAPVLSRAMSWSGALKREGSSPSASALTPTAKSPTGTGGVSSPGQTRLQATFLAIKKMSAGLSSPRFDLTPNKQKEGSGRSPGYFDVTTGENEN
ncbi:thioredoxin-like protein [Boeremia exigua]|uniref:thioredoxin-like protein n=1 Tax=Boeremia exigua TaxID=749465 RepID=UPI001E8CA020|nr:thioredoxin-like protein [Boeremia exigua]KAH6625557.1 thioredoxin-like protein [Boeremia exigua]